jgi:putative CocE/NonD family hydrolase
MKSSVTLIDCGNGVRLERSVPCRMRDGITLISDHYYPAGSGPAPTLLMRQPYGRDIASTVVYAHPVWFARAGYHVVIQDVRGRGDSEGTFYPFRNEATDGFDTLSWLVQHPACNGKIGMYGFSYQGATQFLAAAEHPPGLVAIAPWMTTHDLYHGWFYHNGALRLAATLGWGIQMLREDVLRGGSAEATRRLEDVWLDVRRQALYTPYGALPALDQPGTPSYVKDWISHPHGDDYWRAFDLNPRLLQLPALHLSGWHDLYLKGSIDTFLAFRAADCPNQYLIAGPWIHIPWGTRAGDADLGEAAALDTNLILLRWFNHWLKGSDEFANEPPIRHFALGANRWYTAQTWPRQTSCSFYLRSSGNANSAHGDGQLSTTVPDKQEPRDFYIYDPEVPVVAPGGITAAAGCFDQYSLEQGNNLLVYTSSPLDRALHIFGHPKLVLFAASSRPSTDFVGKLVRVRPDGRAEFISIGIARSDWMFSHGLAPDEPFCWEFDLEPTSCVFAPGERVRLEIASSAFPLYDRNSGSSVPPSEADPSTWCRATQAILHEPAKPSRLELPLAAAG